ncbi:PREDICTED: uncharacterized protein LOC106816452 [Priapulus caudatus]|uniref:Uncharacterized protein LOC106816452 n=1 Tax=Priapulus caudatus TaxID=37621 RepID=A0ABM1EWJ0_PRICU|nr:PREDICTED: uncharacterized protein LOC106816452 [Priapulus caudatus]
MKDCYVKPDMTPQERARWQALRQELGMRRDQGEYDLMIRRGSKPTWMKKAVQKAVKKKHELFQRWLSLGRRRDYEDYAKQRNKAGEMRRNARRDHEKHLVDSFKIHPKICYAYIRNQQKVKVGVTQLKRQDGMLTNSDKDAASLLHNFYYSVFIQEGGEGIPVFDNKVENDHTIRNIRFTTESIKKKLDMVKPDKSPGPDKIHPKFLKECAEVLAKPCVTYKVMESLLNDHIVEHLNINDLFTPHQHGFTAGKSCLTNLLETFEDWTSALDCGASIDTVFLDYQKAFDTVPHRRLIIAEFHIHAKGGLMSGLPADAPAGSKSANSLRLPVALGRV